ncbi:type II secretion system protein GspG [Persicirhabdus sediminis]|uniref:Type II secretion system protein GspG n=1 Tax=Persicirhabdus sediminis TaxID=454144 RepID=A0A8J7MCC5_9BACT|nr:type II secretion system protein GspG [Persicirhabdus sediminis]MBK1790493.1 type II secretion system protein GspG [Persicirhabdus sediminis]
MSKVSTLIVLVLIQTILLLFIFDQEFGPMDELGERSKQSAELGPEALNDEWEALQKRKKVTLMAVSETTDQLNQKDGDAEEDMQIIQQLFSVYRSALGSHPIGENDEITAALTGDNDKGVAVIDASHPSISSSGELLDRWGHAYFFHNISESSTEIRSAGPDGQMHTEDDIVVRY